MEPDVPWLLHMYIVITGMRVDLLRLKGGDGVADPVCDPTFSSWGFGGRRKPPDGARGGAPEANAFWQQSIQIWLKIRSLDRRLHP